ncbi:MAG: hypothetical protein COX70_01180 [Flavobacteriales bacterium CG_4_10_14_0_2_um_filter_32_8]|nr:MAG: hypothetical protein COX70_01180 [Flavobacteriales bacterium CG_4_10_14_0_2_um_filter_32_8]PJB14665.1 MAG: hypothetical protein CO118_07425 [Flavobacteriales bacterium CG_4_9_14_3_um_filter_32_8]
MSIETKKLGLIEKLMQIKEEGILKQYENLLKQAHLQYRAEESIKAIEDGQTITLSVFKTENEEWLNNSTTK